MKSIVASLLFLTKSSFSSGGGWDYDHMSDWHHDYSMCDNSAESPINIVTDEVVYDSSICTSRFNWTLDWSVHTFKIANNGHSVALRPVKKTTIDPDGELAGTVIDEDGTAYLPLSENDDTIARLPNYFLPEGSPHSEFCLDSFHFHWGDINTEGSEHLVDDYQYPMEVHFVHYSCEHASLGSTLGGYETEEDVLEGRAAGDDVYELAVVGIFFELTDYDNPLFDAILSEETLDRIQFTSDISGITSDTVVGNVYLQDIIPEEVFTDGYFSYEGSLTTPPCTDIVRWHVMNAKSYIGKAQIARFRELMYTSNKTMAPNFREVQENVRDVYACFEKEVIPDVVTAAEKTERAIIWVYAVFIIFAMIGMGVICFMRSKREKLATSMGDDQMEKRERLASKSSIGRSSIGGAADIGHNMSRQSSYNAGSRGSLHKQSSRGSLHKQSSHGGHH